jgi:hypothetical protein
MKAANAGMNKAGRLEFDIEQGRGMMDGNVSYLSEI